MLDRYLALTFASYGPPLTCRSTSLFTEQNWCVALVLVASSRLRALNTSASIRALDDNVPQPTRALL